MPHVSDDDLPEETPDHVVQCRGSDKQSPSLAVINAVAELHGCEPTELDSLYTTVDPDALDALVSNSSPSVENPYITFEYGGASVEIQQTDQLTVVAKPSD